ncbi:hypothetical protein HJFPF1_01141 [Paramyrothecium foliicola]|nr:hypothetical protein HJFPF1_01141 [Paramyrothecium foliicola]
MIMGEQHYIATGLPHSGGLSGHPDLTDFSQTSATSQDHSYEELTTYSSVSTFTLPTQCDSSLLTPISSVSSPPLHQVHQSSRQYSVAPGTPQSQECASPGDQKMYQSWTNHLELNAHNSGTNSPMATQASVGAEYLDSYVSEGRRTPAPPPAYLGNFAVSDPSDSHSMHQPDSPYYQLGMAHLEHHNSLSMRDAQPLGLESAHRGVARSMAHMPTIAAPSALNNNSSPHLRHSSRDSHDETVFLHYPNEDHRGPSGSPGRRVLPGSNRVKKPRAPRRQSRNPTRVLDPSAEHKNCYGEEVPPTLKSDTPPQERCIWEARWKHRYSKGNNMWDNIWQEYNKAFEGHKVPKGRGARENLQMKFKRSRCKFLEWLPRDDEILSEAWHIMERDRYRNLLNLFLELGGSRNMCLGAEDVEVRVVHNLKLEENLYMETHGDLGTRRRRRIKREPKKRNEDDYIQPDIEMATVTGPPGTSMEQDAVIDQVFDLREIKDEEDLSDDDGIMDVNVWNRHVDTKVDPRGYLERRGS